MTQTYRAPAFRTTRWSVVLRAGVGDGDGRAALEQLCRSYWFPLYALARRRGLGPADAEDAVQGFFADFLARGDVARADRARGRFRAFLATAFRNFLAKEHERARTLKRGGGVTPVSLDGVEAEARYAGASGRALGPEALFDRAFALALLDSVLAGLRADYARRGREAWFDALRHGLTGEAPEAERAELAARLRTTEGALKVALHRLRERYRAAVRAAVRDTVDDDADVDGELAALFRALGG